MQLRKQKMESRLRNHRILHQSRRREHLKIMSAATLLTILEEGIDIMFERIRDTLKKEKQLIAEAKAEGKAEAYREMAAWDERRRHAESRGEPFTEPLPTPPEKRSKK